MDTLLQDFRYAIRKLVKTPGFTVIAGFTLALAIGANTAIFSVVNGVLLEPLPFRNPEQLVRVTNLRDDRRPSPSSAADFIDFRDQSRSFSGMSVISDATMNLTGGAEPERLESARVSANFFQLLGVTPARGRGFVPDEDKPGAGRVAVLSDALWRRRFAADSQIIGQSIVLDGNPYTVIGVAPAGFAFPDTPDLWTPLVFSEDDISPSNRGSHWLGAIGRVKDGVSIEQADRELATIASRLEKQFPESNTGWKAGAIPLHEFLVGDVKPALFIMLGAVGFVLLIACANVANLLLVRASGRETEMAVRTALGAGRWRIVRQLVTESVLLSAIGGAAGALLAVWGVDLLVRFGPENLPRLEEVRVDASVLAFTAGIALLTGLLFGVLPALHASRPNLNSMLKEGARGSSGRRGAGRVRGMLVIAEMALAVVLLIGAGLLIRSFSKLLSVDPGFRAERVMTFNVAIPESKYGTFHRMRGATAEIVERMKAVPGVQSAAAITGLPMSGWMMRTSMHITGTPQEAPAERKLVNVAPVTPGYFATMGIPMKRGRDFSENDRNGAPIVSVISEEAAKRYFPGQDPLGKRIELGWTQDTSATAGDTATMGGEIIGIVGNTKRRDLASDVFPEVYMAYDQAAINEFSVVVRTTADPATVGAAVRAQLRAMDPDLPIFDFRQLSELIADSVSRPRFYMTLLGTFAAVALLLAAVGIYGVISYTVSQRTRELGIRIALGATRAQVVRLVLGQGMALTLVGVAIGVVAAFWVTRLIASLLFGVGAVDPATFAAVSAVLMGIAALACYVPARRAAQVDPVTAIRAE